MDHPGTLTSTVIVGQSLELIILFAPFFHVGVMSTMITHQHIERRSEEEMRSERLGVRVPA